MSAQFGCFSYHSNQVCCPQCGKEGSVVWQARSGDAGRDFVRIEGSFYERIAKRAPYAIELVCNGCGTAQTGPLQA